MIYIIGTGCGPGSLTKEAAEALRGAVCLIGAERLLDMIPGQEKVAATRAEEILAAIRETEKKVIKETEKKAIKETEKKAIQKSEAETAAGDICVLMSGDSGFYSGTKRLLPLLEDYEVRVLPGISSVQMLAARCGKTWQDWRLCSAHGADCDAVREVCQGQPVFFLTGGKLGPAQLCAQLAKAGLSDLPVVIGENLGTEQERIVSGTAGGFAGENFAVLSVMLAEPATRPFRRAAGLPDDVFERTEKVPMTKQYVRAAILAKLAPGPGEVCWDVGVGTGSVAIEMALQAGSVYGVERSAEAVELAERNRRKLGAWNLRLFRGSAPDALRELPAPDVVFIGGSGGNLREILTLVQEKNAAARICVSAVTVETLSDATAVLEELGYDTDVVQIAVSQSRKVAKLHMMTAQNTIWLITGEPAPQTSEEQEDPASQGTGDRS